MPKHSSASLITLIDRSVLRGWESSDFNLNLYSLWCVVQSSSRASQLKTAIRIYYFSASILLRQLQVYSVVKDGKIILKYLFDVNINIPENTECGCLVFPIGRP